MASSSRPYQSRLLQFLLGQSYRAKARLARSLRQVKLATGWGTQVVLYPVYALFQTARLASRQLQGEATAPIARTQERRGLLWSIKRLLRPKVSDLTALEAASIAPPLTSDRPILQILNLFKPDTDSNTSSQKRSLTPASGSTLALRSPDISTLQSLPHTIHGIACQLDDQALVLVGEQNRIWHGLTSDQQAQLRQQISWLLADYFYRKRQAENRLRSRLGILPPPAPLAKALPPINGLRQAIAWMQTGPVAIAANLFCEADLSESLRSSQPGAISQSWSVRLSPTAMLLNTRPTSTNSPKIAAAQLETGSVHSVSRLEKYEDQSAIASRTASTQLTQTDQAIASLPLSISKADTAISKIDTAIPEIDTESRLQQTTAADDYIDAKVTSARYVEHPLETLLRWIDKLLSVLEDAIQKCAQRLKQPKDDEVN